MTRRPTVEDVQHTQHLVYVLADRDQDLYELIAFMVDALVWVITEADLAHRAVGHPPGTDAHTIGRHGLHRPTEDRLEWGTETGRGQRGGPAQPVVEPADRLYRNLRDLYRTWQRRLDGLARDMRADAEDKAHWPRRSEVDRDLPYADEV
jgi:hypothetical protein